MREESCEFGPYLGKLGHVEYKGDPCIPIRHSGYRCVHGRIHGVPMDIGKYTSTSKNWNQP